MLRHPGAIVILGFEIDCVQGRLTTLRYFLATILSRMAQAEIAAMSQALSPLPLPEGFGEPAHAIRRGTLRLLHSCGFTAAAELALGSGRRADLVALGPGA